jgi:hypothetical protein
VNATNVTANSWLFLNISYNESDVSTVSEYGLKMYGHNGTAWEEVRSQEAMLTLLKTMCMAQAIIIQHLGS